MNRALIGMAALAATTFSAGCELTDAEVNNLAAQMSGVIGQQVNGDWIVDLPCADGRTAKVMAQLVNNNGVLSGRLIIPDATARFYEGSGTYDASTTAIVVNPGRQTGGNPHDLRITLNGFLRDANTFSGQSTLAGTGAEGLSCPTFTATRAPQPFAF
jgi:hypothetical protein